MEAFLHDLSWVPPLRTPTLTLIFNGFTFLGYTPFFIAFLPLGYWLWDKPMFTRLAILVGIVGLSNTFLKELFQDPRPPIEFALDKRVGDSFGLPSGHAQIAAAMWLWLAIELRRSWAWALAIFITLGVAASRIYLGVHDMEDVIAGTLLGITTVIVFHGLLSSNFETLNRLNPIFHLAAIAALVPIVMAIWPKEPVPGSMFALVAFMFAWLMGDQIQQAWIGQRRHPNWLVAIIASVVAVAALFATFKLAGDQMIAANLPASTVLIAQSVIVSIFATVIAPALFRLLRLSGPSS